jgi:hypothetical protein
MTPHRNQEGGRSHAHHGKCIAGVATLALAGASSGIAVGKATNSAGRFVPHNGSTFLKIILPTAPISPRLLRSQIRRPRRDGALCASHGIRANGAVQEDTARRGNAGEAREGLRANRSISAGSVQSCWGSLPTTQDGKGYACAYLQVPNSSGPVVASEENTFEVV